MHIAKHPGVVQTELKEHVDYEVRVCEDFGDTVRPVRHVIEVSNIGWSTYC